MTIVRFDGWQPGFDKVAQNRLLRQRAGMGFREAKDAVDRIVAGEKVVLSLRSESDAVALVRESTAVGAQCAIVAGVSSVGSAMTND
jgi:hypothetical protein